MMRFLRLLLLLLLPLTARAQFEGKVLLEPSLVADTATVAPGKPFTAGLLLKMAPGWHTYWEFSGDAGAALTVEWQLPPGFKAGPIQWPLPHARMDEGDLLSYVYEGEVLLPVEITPPAQLPPGEVPLKASLRWLVCEKTCIPGKGDVELILKTADQPAPANTELFAKWRAQLPKAGSPFPVQWDTSNPKELRVRIAGLPPEVKLEFFPLPPEGATPEHPLASPPAADGVRTVTVPLAGSAPAGAVWRGLLVAQNGDKPREGWLVSAADAASPAPSTPPPAPARAPAASLLSVLLTAFLGGLILNVMPCVLPVIALKIFGFVSQAGDDPRRVARLGYAFVGGVFVFFLGLATAIVVLKSAGRGFNWGFQFQNPYVLAGLIALVFVFGLNLLGVFEVTLSSGATSKLSDISSQEGYRGAFMHGLFTTLLGTSCTAPLLAPTLGYAVTQPAAIVYLLFATIAAGLSLPYFILTSRPGWLKHLPKPGLWMERFKQMMGFVMLAIVVWLFTVFAGRGVSAVTALSWYLFLLAIACWAYGVISHRSIGALLALAMAITGYFTFLHGKLDARPAATAEAPSKDGIPWQPFSEGALEAARKANRPVFIDFTASWCLNCKFFEGTVLAHESVAKAFAERGIVALKADWTNQDATITKYLNQFGRVGVPLYVLYRPGEEQPVVQDALTRQGLLEELARKP